MEFIDSDISAKSFLQSYKPTPIQVMGRRQWITKFLVEINSQRFEQDRLDLPRMGRTLKRWQDWELPVLWKLCETSKNFSQYFWWAYKQKTPPPKSQQPKQLTMEIKRNKISVSQ